jgi:hypothetical protein
MLAEAGSFSSSKRRVVGCNVDPPSGIAKPLAGGEPLSMMAALSVCSRRLPGITQLAVCAQGRRPNDPDTPKSLQNLEPFLFVGPQPAIESPIPTNNPTPEPRLHYSNTPSLRSPGFEDEDDDEDENEAPGGEIPIHETPRHCRSSA